MPTVSIEAMNKHLTEISRCVSPGAIALLILDAAGWHSSPQVVVPENIVLLPLPPYAPGTEPRRKHLGVSARQRPQQLRLGNV